MNETWWLNSADLDDDQKKVLKADIDESLLIQGPPGSGKTNILLLRANYVRSKYPRLLFITFTRTLTEFLRSGPSIGRADQIKSNEISTFMAWGKSFLRDAKSNFVDPGKGFKESRKLLIKSLESYIQDNQPGVMYDSIFIDEVQDFRESELEILRKLTHTINTAGDSRQTIWNHKEGLPKAHQMADAVVELTRHYRIGRKICEYADRILPPKAGDPQMVENCAYDEDNRPSSVTTIVCSDDDDQYAKCIEAIRRQIRYISDEPILVVAHSSVTRDEFWAALKKDPTLEPKSMIQSNDGYEPFGPNSLIRVMTIASAKGSEARAVHILKADGLTSALRELAFTAVTRAKTEANLYHSEALPGHLEPQNDELPEIEDLF